MRKLNGKNKDSAQVFVEKALYFLLQKLLNK